jgi:O-antigen/teichoic acid export membrane protein
MGRFEIANFRPARYLAMNLGRGLFIIVGAGTAAWTTHSPIWTAIGTAIGTGLAAVLGGFKRWKLGPAHFDRDLARQVLAFGLPLAVSMAVGGLVNSGTRALLEVLDSPQALGLYTASFLLVVSTINLVAGGIVVASYQLAVRAVESGDSEAARRQLVANGTLLMAVLAPAALGMALMAHGLAATMVGPQFVEPVAMLTPWMAASAFFGGLRAHYLDHAFQLGRRPALLVTVAAGAAVVGLGLGVVLIPRFGPLGAAIASAVAMAVSCVQGWLTGRAAFPLPLPLAGFARVLLACLVMAAVVLCIPDGGLASVAARVAAGALSYAGAAVALDVLGLRDGVWQALCRGTGVWRIRSLRQ